MRKILLTVILATAVGSAATEQAEMIAEQIEARGVRDPRVLEALRAVPREEFVPEELEAEAFADRPLPIGHGQTISQPYIVAIMTEMLESGENDRVLEIGTGSGYQAAVLSQLAKKVYSIEVVEPLGLEAKERLQRLGYENVEVRIGDGYKGWPAEAPFDRIILTAAPPEIPQALIDQLAPGGRLVAPEGHRWGMQYLITINKDEKGRIKRKRGEPVRFVPMVHGEEK